MGLGFDHERELMSPHKEKLALFIDGANLYATAKSLLYAKYARKV